MMQYFDGLAHCDVSHVNNTISRNLPLHHLCLSIKVKRCVCGYILLSQNKFRGSTVKAYSTNWIKIACTLFFTLLTKLSNTVNPSKVTRDIFILIWFENFQNFYFYQPPPPEKRNDKISDSPKSCQFSKILALWDHRTPFMSTAYFCNVFDMVTRAVLEVFQFGWILHC